MNALGAEPAASDPKQQPAGSTQLAQVQVAAPSGPAPEKIEISAQREHYRGDVAVEDLPQSVQVISGETLKLVGAVKINDALDLAAGVARQNTFGGVWDSFAIRGFAGDINVPSGYLVNGFNSGRGFGGLRDTSSIEKMEILKGPGSALFGRSEPGGTVAITTRRPQFKPEGSVTLSAGSDDFLRAEADYTTPVAGSTAVRINGAIDEADTFRDTGIPTKRSFASPSILSRLGRDTSVWYELEWARQEIPFDRGVVASRTGGLGVIPVSRYLGEPGDGPTVAKVLGHQAQLQHNLAKGWVLLAGAAYRETYLEGIGQTPELAAARQPYFTDGVTLSRQRRFTDYDSSNLVLRTELSGTFKTGGITHHLLTGADYEEFELTRLQTRYRPPVFSGQSLAVMNAVNILNPVYGNAPSANQNVFNDIEKDKAYGIYLTDQMDLTDALKLRIGGRYDWFEQTIDNRLTVLQPPKQDVTAFSPQVGLTWRAFEGLHLYTMYAKGFRPQTGFDFDRNAFEPEETKSFEVGVKFEAFDGNLAGTVAAYTMKKTNVLTADPNPAHQGFVIAIGEAESRGIEFDISGTLPGRLQVLFSYAYTDAYSASDVRDADFARVVSKGDPLLNIPKHNASVLVTKDVDVAGKRLTFGGGAKYVSRRLGETGTNFYLPAYTLMRIFGTYHVTSKWSVTGEVTNLTDKEHYPASFASLWVVPGAPRQFQVRTTYRF